MSYEAEQDLAELLAAWPVAEARIIHLYELDPTHVAAHAGSDVRRSERHGARESRSQPPFCLLAEAAPVPVLLELDPAHFH